MQDFATIPSNELVDMLLKDTEYYMMLTKDNTNPPEKMLVQNHINLIVAELKNREGYSEVFSDNSLGIITQG
ncbi:MAG TPA: hypothetical protein VK489_09665 [Ferruginibacter sp.]|nr:hypothetical protein [Ferruginibacter sp.]